MPNTLTSHLVFVYGTLMAGFANHRVLGPTPCSLGAATTVDKFTMYTNGYFPALTLQELYTVRGEVYKVSDSDLIRLDRLEGYDVTRTSNHYERKLVTVALHSGDKVNAWVYYQKEPGYRMEKLPIGCFADYAAPVD